MGKRMTLEEWKTLSEIVSNFASPLATVAVALIAVWGAREVTERIVEAKGEGSTAVAHPGTGKATVTANASAPRATATAASELKQGGVQP